MEMIILSCRTFLVSAARAYQEKHQGTSLILYYGEQPDLEAIRQHFAPAHAPDMALDDYGPIQLSSTVRLLKSEDDAIIVEANISSPHPEPLRERHEDDTCPACGRDYALELLYPTPADWLSQEETRALNHELESSGIPDIGARCPYCGWEESW